MKKNLILKASAAPFALGLALAASPALAQTTDAQEETTETEAGDMDAMPEDTGSVITVTGSRIARPELESAASLVAVIGEEQIERRGFTNISQALNEVPGFGTPVSSAGGQA